ncbi:MAG: sulfatase-like hydrolase/transferase, partial [Eudoraea sp.]|nr:sulfatase-like hydrolase/transferase [Eudoraea sp.]
LIHAKALTFMESHIKEPFFLYYPSIIPHAELAAPKAYMEKYLGKLAPEKAFKGRDSGEEYRNGDYESQPNAHAAFAAMIHLLDDQVGEILDKVKALGLEKNTLIIFTSDNGPHLEGGADPDYFDSNGIYKGYKRDLYEGGIHVPMIAKWSGKIEEGSSTDHVSAFWDVLPTIAELIHANVNEKIDGISFLPTLLKKNTQQEHDHLYWEFHEKGGRQAIRKDNWKLVRYDIENNGKYELYNLKQDPSEANDLSEDLPEKVVELSAVLEASRTPSEVFRFKQQAYDGEK